MSDKKLFMTLLVLLIALLAACAPAPPPAPSYFEADKATAGVIRGPTPADRTLPAAPVYGRIVACPPR